MAILKFDKTCSNCAFMMAMAVWILKFLQTGYEEPAGVTQPEINRLVQSLHKAPSQLAATTAKINNSN